MVALEKIDDLLKPALQDFKEMERLRIVSHYDADGISAASIILAASLRAGKEVHLSIVEQIRPGLIEELNEEPYENVVFTDLGSGHLSLINELEGKRIVILDHHHPEGELEGGSHVNPHLAGLEEGSLSGAGTTYLFVRGLSEGNKDLAPLAVVGAIGDLQEEKGLMRGLNKEILEEAEELSLLGKERGLRLFGRLSRPIHKSLEYTTRPYIPNVTENESGSIQFLSELEIDPKDSDGSWKKLSDLNKDEKKKLASAIIKERMNEGMEEAEEIFGNIYTLKNFDGRFKDARELSTALNACGRMSQAEIGVLACLDDPTAKEKLEDIVEGYKKTLGKLVGIVEEGREELIRKEGSVVVLDGVGEIPENFIGTVCSILHSRISQGKILLGFAESEEGMVKVSGRAPEGVEANLGELVSQVAEELGGEGGGHKKAGGAYVKKDRKNEFVKSLKDALRKQKA